MSCGTRKQYWKSPTPEKWQTSSISGENYPRAVGVTYNCNWHTQCKCRCQLFTQLPYKSGLQYCCTTSWAGLDANLSSQSNISSKRRVGPWYAYRFNFRLDGKMPSAQKSGPIFFSLIAPMSCSPQTSYKNSVHTELQYVKIPERYILRMTIFGVYIPWSTGKRSIPAHSPHSLPVSRYGTNRSILQLYYEQKHWKHQSWISRLSFLELCFDISYGESLVHKKNK